MTFFRHSKSWLRATLQCRKANKAWRSAGLLATVAIVVPTSSPIYGQGTGAVSVVNMIPRTLSGETGTDSEPNLAVNPSNTRHIAASAFTPDPMAGANAPIYISTDGGQSWALNSIVPGNAAPTGTHDITLRFGSRSNVLYAAVLRGDKKHVLSILRTNDYTSANTMTTLVSRAGVDMPYVEAISVAGTDRVYVGNSNSDFAAIDRSLDAATARPPAGFTSHRIEARNTCGKDGPSIRPAIHKGGTIYAAFFRWTQCTQYPYTSDVVVVRDDNFATGPSGAFTALREQPAPAGDGMPGVRVVTGRPVPFNAPSPAGLLGGNQRIGTRISITVDPNNSKRVYLAWGDGPDAANYALYVRRSIDGGATWSNNLRVIHQATNPSLAINSRGRVGFLYQKLTGTASNPSWETHLERTDDDFATPIDVILHRAPNLTDTSGAGPLGDYNHLLAVRRDFYGVFSGNNTPKRTNFPHGVKYQRNADFTTGKLLAVDNMTEVDPSIDPFFFKVRESRRHR